MSGTLIAGAIVLGVVIMVALSVAVAVRPADRRPQNNDGPPTGTYSRSAARRAASCARRVRASVVVFRAVRLATLDSRPIEWLVFIEPR